jgi:hypothetical protein
MSIPLHYPNLSNLFAGALDEVVYPKVRKELPLQSGALNVEYFYRINREYIIFNFYKDKTLWRILNSISGHFDLQEKKDKEGFGLYVLSLPLNERLKDIQIRYFKETKEGKRRSNITYTLIDSLDAVFVLVYEREYHYMSFLNFLNKLCLSFVGGGDAHCGFSDGEDIAEVKSKKFWPFRKKL